MESLVDFLYIINSYSSKSWLCQVHAIPTMGGENFDFFFTNSNHFYFH
jgi:hypothetical protein